MISKASQLTESAPDERAAYLGSVCLGICIVSVHSVSSAKAVSLQTFDVVLLHTLVVEHQPPTSGQTEIAHM